MDFGAKLFSIFALVFIIFAVQNQSQPLEGNSVANVSDGEEMMEAAESQNPFLPRFAMLKLRERSEKARAQRRNYQAQRRSYQHQPARSQVWCSHYVSF